VKICPVEAKFFHVEGWTGRHCNRTSRGLNSKPYIKACLEDTLLEECEVGSYSSPYVSNGSMSTANENTNGRRTYSGNFHFIS